MHSEEQRTDAEGEASTSPDAPKMTYDRQEDRAILAIGDSVYTLDRQSFNALKMQMMSVDTRWSKETSKRISDAISEKVRSTPGLSAEELRDFCEGWLGREVSTQRVMILSHELELAGKVSKMPDENGQWRFYPHGWRGCR